jgi:murein DD-endopeptidase MepM/ murein hydrolase activator NlpD
MALALVHHPRRLRKERTMIPVPGYGISTPYGKRGSYWSCDRDAQGNGKHTGADFAAPSGTKVVAARPGQAVYSNHGSAFGYHQLDIIAGDGTRDFYAHMTTRTVNNGARVEAGAQVGKVGAEGNVTGPHLHFERHAVASGGWSCSIVRDPQPSIDYQPASSGGGGAAPPPQKEDDPMPKFSRTRISKPIKVKAETWTNLTWDTVSSGDAGTKGQAFLMLGKTAFSGTLNVTVTPTNPKDDVIRTRWIERQEKGSGWETTEAYPALEHKVTEGGTYLADSRTQNLPAKTRLVCQVHLKHGGTVQSADCCVIYWGG